MPRETSRACAPSCRSRSIRRSSAAEASTAWERDSASWPTCAAIAPRVGASSDEAAQACALRISGPIRTPSGSMLSKNTCPQKPGGAPGHQPKNKVPDIEHQRPHARDDQERGQQPQDHAHRHVDQHPEQVTPGRGVGQQPLAALQPPDQPVGELHRPGPVRRGDRHPRPVPRPVALPAGQPPHGQQASRREQDPDPRGQGRSGRAGRAKNSRRPASETTARTSPRTQVSRVSRASRPTTPRR